MAKVTIMGDAVQIKSALTKSEFDRVKAFAPEALKLFDTEGNEVFGISMGNANYSKYGICFCAEDAEGKIFMTMNNPVIDHNDAEKERTEIIKYFAPAISKLEAVEANVTAAKDSLEKMEASVTESVVFA
jgi:hypothetical protein